MSRQLVIIPVYNEESTIKEVLGELCHHYSGDVLLVNDGSTDNSMERIHHCIEKRPIKIIEHPANLGYGRSLIDGFRFAQEGGYDVAVTMDCDWQHQPQHVPEFFSHLGGYDILSGSRYLRAFAEDTSAPADRQSINSSVTTELNKLTGYDLTDSFCGFKAYRVSALMRLDLDEEGYAFPIQFWLQAFAKKLTVAEFPVARIYTGAARSFGATLDDSAQRLAYYREVLHREVQRWHL